MNLQIILLSAASILVASACSRDMSTDPGKVNVRDLTQGEQRLTNAGEQFGISMFKTIAATDESNIFISPLSISMALGMTLNGAAGETESAMRRTLGFGDMDRAAINEGYAGLIKLLTSIDGTVQFEIANSIWADAKFQVEPAFIDVNKSFFDALIKAIDFRAAGAPDQINAWVDEKTHGKIAKIIDSIDAQTRMYLINAVYFKGIWTYEFNKSDTREDVFQTGDSVSIRVPFMNQTNDSFDYFDNDLMQAIDLPYGNGQFRMTVLLPHSGKSTDDLLQQLTTQTWAEWMHSFVRQKGTLKLPKFKIEYQKSLVETLASLGMGAAFSDRADFSGISKTGPLAITDVLHKTYVDVYEEGTEAAAVTAVSIGVTSIGGGGISGFYMSVDKPFLFAIREKSSGAILFIGRINNPLD